MKSKIRFITAIAVATIALMCSVTPTVYAQNVVLEPTKARNSNGDFVTRLLVKPDRAVRVNWSTQAGTTLDLTGRNAFLKIGTLPNNYTFRQISLTGSQQDFRPQLQNLPPGRYYARITNASGNRMASILSAFSSDPSNILYSNEIQIIVESPTAAYAISPRGDVTNSTPTFSWEPVPGAVGYWIILSSTPFRIEDNDGEISITGVSGVWQYMTTETTATYGEIVDAFPDEPPPLNDGQEYSYTILNLYEEENPVYVSPVFGGIIPFRYRNPNALARPVLQSPSNNTTFNNTPLITFRWNEVPGATNYTVRLSKRLTQSGAEVTLPIWSTTTTNTLIDFNASGALENTLYTWQVIANDDFGRGSTSLQREFRYQVQTGQFEVATFNSADGSIVTGVEIKALAVSGGSTSALSYLNQTGSVNDSLVVGTYEFTAVKNGFRDAVETANILDGRYTYVRMNLEPLPSGISGRVLDNTGQPAANATIETTNLSTSERITVSTNTNGDFNQSMQPGSYSVIARKAGYIASSTRFYDLALGEQVDEERTFTIQNDLATISGFVFNQSGNPIQLARVTVRRGTNEFDALTNGQGYYSINVSSGTWSIRAQKTGFVSPPPSSVSVGVGDNVQNQNFNLPAGANQVSGTVRRVVTNADGTTGLASFAGVQVTAIPTVGNPVSAVTGNNGQYSLSLPAGNYTVRLAREGFTPSGQTSLNLSITETVTGVNFELVPNPSSISGRVSTPDGTAVGDVTINIPGVNPVVTTASGTFTISVPEGTHQVSAFRSGYVSPTPQSVALSPGQNLTGINFSMSANAGQVSGRVTSSGQALSNVTVTSRSISTNATLTQSTNDDGVFSLSVRPGRYAIQASRHGFLPSQIDTVNLGPGQQLTGLNYSLTENLARVRGTVTDNDAPMRNVRVTITRPDDPTFEQFTLTLINGSYSFAVPAGNPYRIQTSITGYGNKTATTNALPPSNTPVEFNFTITPNPASIAGNVRNQAGANLANVLIRAFDTEQSIMIDSTITSSNGSYSLGLPVGNYQVSAVRPGYRSESLSIPLQNGQNLSAIDFSLDENFAFVQGVIEDPNGDPLEDVLVNLRGVSGSGATVSTGSDGSYSISRLTTGSYTLRFTKDDYISRSTTIQIRDGQFGEFPFALEIAAGTIAGSILDINGDPIPDAEVFVNNENGIEFQTISNADGEYNIDNLPPGTYVVTVSSSGYSIPSGIEVVLSPGNLVATDANVTDLVPNNASVSGVLRNSATNSPLQGVQVSLSGTEGSGSAITNSDGLYTISNLAPGQYTTRYQRENFRTESITINLSASVAETRDIQMIRNQGRITGRVTNQSGEPLAIIPDIIISSGNDLHRTRANSDGFYEVSNLSTGLDYKIETSVFRNGYVNAEVNVNYPLGEGVLTQNLTVQINEGRVEGTTGTSETSVRLIRTSDGSVVSTTQANADGEYSFTFLPAGEYRVSFSKPGFQFQPAQSNNFNLAFNQTLAVNTNSQPNIGEILVRTTTGGSTPLGSVEVRILSSDNRISRSVASDNTGEVRFSEVPAGITYTVSASRQGFSAVPGSQQVQVTVGSTQNISFDMVPASSNLQGATRRLNNGETSNLGAVTVRARNLTNGVTRQVNSNAQGSFAIDDVPTGQYELIASRSGYISDTLNVVVAQGQTIDNLALDLELSLFNLTGRIVLRGTGVGGVEVNLVSTTTQTSVTNNQGFYRFNDLPLSTNANDTTVYQVRFELGGNVYTRLIRATRDNLGQNVSAPQVVLPSGQIQATFTDGVQSLSGVNISFGRIGGSTSTAVTGTDGAFSSSNTLRRSTYQLSYTRIGYLTPQSPLLVELTSDTTAVALIARLPYRHTEIDEIRADEAQQVVVTFPTGYTPSEPNAILSYRKSSDSQFSTASMSIVDGAFVGEIPALFSTDDITYFVSITDSDITYTSSQITKTPLASGILSSFRFTPQIDQQILRVGDTYQLRLDIADGISQTLNDEFIAGGEGIIDWAEQAGITISESAGTGYTFTPNEAGNYTLSATIAYRGVELSGQQRITVVSDPITELDVRSSVSRVQNTSPLLYSYVATDAQGRRQLLGSALQWAVEPAEAGTITQNGVFRAASDEYIGQARIVLTDSKTDITNISESVTVFAEVRSNRSYVFSDRQGMILRVPENSVESTSEITVRNVEPEAVKKNVFLENTTDSYVTSDIIYRFNLSAGAFQVPVDLELPIDGSHRFNEGNKIIALFDRSDLVWKPYSSNATPDVVNAVGITQMGQFSVLAQTEPLDIKHLSVLPNPFSPDVAPLRIGYLLTTQAPPAIVNIQIYNMRGELVRTVLRDDLQYQGRYGSRTGIKEITWDGLTNSGTMSRNGRYVIRVHVKDAEKEEVKLIPVVLVK